MAGQGLEVAPAPAPPVTGTPVMGLGKGITASLVVALFVALGEVNRLSGQVLDDQARPWSFTALMGPGAFGAVDGWSATFPAYAGERATWLLLYVVLDVVLIVIYGLVVAGWLAAHGAGLLAWVLRVLAVVDVLEDGFALLTVHTRSVPLAYVTAVLSSAKWLAVLVAVLVAAYTALQSRTGHPVVAPRALHPPVLGHRHPADRRADGAGRVRSAGPASRRGAPVVREQLVRGRALLGRRGRCAAHGAGAARHRPAQVRRLLAADRGVRPRRGEGQPVARRHRPAGPRHRAGRRRRGVPPVAVGPSRLRPRTAGVLPAGPGRDRCGSRGSSVAGATRAGPGRHRCSAPRTTR